jgi:hypothetical protein
MHNRLIFESITLVNFAALAVLYFNKKRRKEGENELHQFVAAAFIFSSPAPPSSTTPLPQKSFPE